MRNFNGNVVEERQWGCADAQHIIDIHGNTVDADCVVLVHHFGHDDFGTDAIRRNGNAKTVSNIYDVREVPEWHFDSVRSEGKRSLHPVREIVHDPVLALPFRRMASVPKSS